MAMMISLNRLRHTERNYLMLFKIGCFDLNCNAVGIKYLYTNTNVYEIYNV